MKKDYQDRRKYLRIPLPNVVHLSLKESRGIIVLAELYVEKNEVLRVELDRISTPPVLKMKMLVGDEVFERTISLVNEKVISYKIPMLREPSTDISLPMVNMIHLSVGNWEPLPAMLVDISSGGARIMSQFPLFKHDEVLLKIPLPDEEDIELKGKVIWSRQMKLMKEYHFGVEYMVGIKFVEASKVIQGYIRRHMGMNVQ